MHAITPAAIQIPAAGVIIDGDLRVPDRAAGLVLFAHGSGSSRFSRRNRQVAEFLEAAGFATLLLDLLTPDEEAADTRTREFRFDVDRLGHRVVAAVDWVDTYRETAGLPVCCFGASTGAAAALDVFVVRKLVTHCHDSTGGSASGRTSTTRFAWVSTSTRSRSTNRNCSSPGNGGSTSSRHQGIIEPHPQSN